MATKEDRRELAAMAGTTVAFFRHHPGLNKLFNKALDEGWTADKLLARIKNSAWYKNRSESQREAETLKDTDPQEYKRRLTQTTSMVRRMHEEMGGSSGFTTSELNRAARLAFYNQWDETQLRRYLGSFHNISIRIRNGKAIGGEAGETLMRLRQAVHENGLRVDNKTMARWVERVVTGRSTEQALMGILQKRAMSAFPALAGEIKGGMSVREYADQYIQTKAELLELNAGEIDVYDRDIRGALNAKSEKGKFSPMTLADFETKMRKDPRWNKTKNARESYLGTAHEVLQSFGVTW